MSRKRDHCHQVENSNEIWVMLFLAILSVLAIVNAVANNNELSASVSRPGKVFMWSPSAAKAEEHHLTASYDVNRAVGAVSSAAKDYEVVVVLSNSVDESAVSRSCRENAMIQESMHRAPSKTVISHVYVTDPMMKPISGAINHAHNVAARPISDVVSDLQAHPEVFGNGKAEVYHANLDLHSQHSFHALQDLAKQQKVLFVAYDEAHTAHTAPRKLGQYTKLQGSDPTVTYDSTSIYYKPEGSEYAIYYADTYLYITPDIFTGLMTGIFFVFVLLTGFSCMGEIQGMSSFYDKLPVVGREA